jgi:hypothetical protein
MELRVPFVLVRRGCSGDVFPPEPRFPGRLAPGLGLGADRAVLYSESLISAPANSSASSELTPSKPAKRLLILGGLRTGALPFDNGPSSLSPA